MELEDDFILIENESTPQQNQSFIHVNVGNPQIANYSYQQIPLTFINQQHTLPLNQPNQLYTSYMQPIQSNPSPQYQSTQYSTPPSQFNSSKGILKAVMLSPVPPTISENIIVSYLTSTVTKPKYVTIKNANVYVEFHNIKYCTLLCNMKVINIGNLTLNITSHLNPVPYWKIYLKSLPMGTQDIHISSAETCEIATKFVLGNVSIEVSNNALVGSFTVSDIHTYKQVLAKSVTAINGTQVNILPEMKVILSESKAKFIEKQQKEKMFSIEDNYLVDVVIVKVIQKQKKQNTNKEKKK